MRFFVLYHLYFQQKKTSFVSRTLIIIENMSLKQAFFILLLGISLFSCKKYNKNEELINTSELKVRTLIDTIGFTQYKWQLDSIISRMPSEDKKGSDQIYKAVICPHDDYSYAGGLYNKTLAGIKAKTIVLIGVAHRARNFTLENKLVFGTFDTWQSTNGNVTVSTFRDRLIRKLPSETYIVHDSMMQLEHSMEAIVPFLQKNKQEVSIIPLLVPYITFENMGLFSEIVAKSLRDIMKEENLQYGRDIAIVISNDAIHYGDEDWGSSNLAPFGVDSLGNEKARQKDLKIIEQCLKGELNNEKIEIFNHYTVQEENYKEYKWTWCGRYSVPFGLLVANKLNNLIEHRSLSGKMIDYRSSYHNRHIKVEDLGMGTTAPANNRHWVGYVGLGYQ